MRSRVEDLVSVLVGADSDGGDECLLVSHCHNTLLLEKLLETVRRSMGCAQLVILPRENSVDISTVLPLLLSVAWPLSDSVSLPQRVAALRQSSFFLHQSGASQRRLVDVLLAWPDVPVILASLVLISLSPPQAELSPHQASVFRPRLVTLAVRTPAVAIGTAQSHGHVRKMWQAGHDLTAPVIVLEKSTGTEYCAYTAEIGLEDSLTMTHDVLLACQRPSPLLRDDAGVVTGFSHPTLVLEM